METKRFSDYIHQIQENLSSGKATEPSYYPALQKLFEGLGTGLQAPEGQTHQETTRRPNLNPAFVAEVERRLGVRVTTSPPNPLSDFGEGGKAGADPLSVSVDGEREQGAEVPERHWRTDSALWDKLKPVARQMRSEPTKAEDVVWQRLRNGQLSGFRFRRQHSIERFIVDFYCAEARLVVEADGPVHDYQQLDDRLRQEFLESQGLRVLRFSNDAVLYNTAQVLQQIESALTSSPSPISERGPGAVLSLPKEGEVSLSGGEVTPEDIFNYAYAVFHSPTYRTRYAELLKTDFPRLPLTSDKVLFAALSAKGQQLVSLHLLTSPLLQSPVTKYPTAGSSTVEKVAYVDSAERVHINKSQYFEGVPRGVWDFQIGGYQVCEKWLKDRKGRKLSLEDIEHYQKVVVAIKETIRIMKEIDDLIPKWPVQ